MYLFNFPHIPKAHSKCETLRTFVSTSPPSTSRTNKNFTKKERQKLKEKSFCLLFTFIINVLWLLFTFKLFLLFSFHLQSFFPITYSYSVYFWLNITLMLPFLSFRRNFNNKNKLNFHIVRVGSLKF